MRMWSLTPAVLDAKGIVACWRESLLAQAVLSGKTKGYTHHPQLERFRACEHPLAAVASYLGPLADEADRRGYHFDRSRILERPDPELRLTVNDGQLSYEWRLLLKKLEQRDPKAYARMTERGPQPHPIFLVVPGPVAAWEKVIAGV
ncbi:pyrimidine dimer DNA glycosylase/endonuclease V [Bifidobacterium crudilactis]|jgi:hypothetical protein|uniref:pyrimidine dimer DNA glycosylase/endonuclease V n=1 Tax=Bifidobacterium crudilactis TaxID=327277 RepID=UPI002F356381